MAFNKLVSLARLLKPALWQWYNHNAFEMAAALAYYTLVSLAPLIIILLAIAGPFSDHRQPNTHRRRRWRCAGADWVGDSDCPGHCRRRNQYGGGVLDVYGVLVRVCLLAPGHHQPFNSH